MTNNITAPYIHTKNNQSVRPREWAVALLPVLIWSVFMFGARVLTLCAVASVFSLGFDYLVRRFIFKLEKGVRVDYMAIIYAFLATFTLPVTVPLFMPVVTAALVVLAKNIHGFRKKRLFNPFIFPAAVLNIVFPKVMTAFTKPFAYFGAFDMVIDQKLMDGYRVLSPLQYMADGSVYEDGVIAQLYGFASGHMGEIAVAAMIIAGLWLTFRKEGNLYGTFALLFPILLLALIFPSDDAESNYYAYSVLLSGGIVFISVFAMNESHTVPITRIGRMIVGALTGILIFVFRKFFGGYEYGYLIVLVMNVISPFIEKLTTPRSLDKGPELTFTDIINKVKSKKETKKEIKDEK